LHIMMHESSMARYLCQPYRAVGNVHAVAKSCMYVYPWHNWPVMRLHGSSQDIALQYLNSKACETCAQGHPE